MQFFRLFLATALSFTQACPVLAADDAAPQAVSSKADDDVVMRAMKDEIARSMKELKLPNKPAPYYIAHLSSDQTKYRFAFSNGSLQYDWKEERRSVWTDVRVGDYQFDNSADVSGTHSSEAVVRATSLDDNYSVLRRSLWDATDQAYKTAIEELENMAAYKSQHSIPGLCESFSKEKPNLIFQQIATPLTIPDELKQKLKQVSKALNSVDGVRESWVCFQGFDITARFVSSEESKARVSYNSGMIGMAAFAKCPDGEELWDCEGISLRDLANVPSTEELEQRARALGERLVRHTSSPIKDYYLGPVLFEPQATAEFTIRDVVPLLCAVKGDNLRPQGTLLRSLNSKVLPNFISISDDPTISEYKGKPLNGPSWIDFEGMPCQKVQLVDHGFLRDFLSSRAPVVKGGKSNGHAIDVDAVSPTTVIVDAEKAVSPKALREKLKALAKEMGLPEYLVVRRIRQATPVFMHGSPSGVRESSLAGEIMIDAVMVSTETGEERSVRGLKFKDLYKPSLQDIVQAGNDAELVMTTAWNGTLRPVICPSILISKIELEADTRPTDAPYPVKKPEASD